MSLDTNREIARNGEPDRTCGMLSEPPSPGLDGDEDPFRSPRQRGGHPEFDQMNQVKMRLSQGLPAQCHLVELHPEIFRARLQPSHERNVHSPKAERRRHVLKEETSWAELERDPTDIADDTDWAGLYGVTPPR